MMIKNILLTGSGGFIGKNLKEYLKNKYKLLCPRSYELNCVDKNAVEKYFSENNIDLIIHCATVGGARGIQDKDTTIEDNLAMVNNLLNAKKSDTKIILFSSGAMYGKQRPIKKISEDKMGEIIPFDLYGQSKLQIAQKVKDLKDVVCLTIFACYGYGEKSSRFPSYAINENLAHKPIIINKNVVFDYLFIDDLKYIVEYFINNNPKKYNVVNVTPSHSCMLSQIAEMVNKISNFKSEIIIKDEVLANEYTGDNSRLLYEIPDIKFTPLNIGIKKLYDYIKGMKS